MWLYKQILKMSWTVHINNQRVLEKRRKEKELIKTLKAREI